MLTFHAEVDACLVVVVDYVHAAVVATVLVISGSVAGTTVSDVTVVQTVGRESHAAAAAGAAVYNFAGAAETIAVVVAVVADAVDCVAGGSRVEREETMDDVARPLVVLGMMMRRMMMVVVVVVVVVVLVHHQVHRLHLLLLKIRQQRQPKGLHLDLLGRRCRMMVLVVVAGRQRCRRRRRRRGQVATVGDHEGFRHGRVKLADCPTSVLRRVLQGGPRYHTGPSSRSHGRQAGSAPSPPASPTTTRCSTLIQRSSRSSPPAGLGPEAGCKEQSRNDGGKEG